MNQNRAHAVGSETHSLDPDRERLQLEESFWTKIACDVEIAKHHGSRAFTVNQCANTHEGTVDTAGLLSD